MSLGERIRARLGTPVTRPRDSASYWEARYRSGGNSGAGSYGRLAEFKADVLNRLVADKGWETVLELGCGDGALLELAKYKSYVGVDVSATAVKMCRERFAGRADRRFVVLGEERFSSCDVALSLDVIYHLVEDLAFEHYMDALSGHALRGIVLYTSDSDVYAPPRYEPAHIRHRPVQRWMAQHRPEWHLTEVIKNRYPWVENDQLGTSFADFYVYER